MPEHARCSPGGNAAISETNTSRTSTAPTTKKICNLKEEKTSNTVSIGRLDGGTTESHGETGRQHLHLQLRSGQLRNGKRVGAHGSLHLLRNGGDFGFLERIPENRRGVETRHPPKITHLCSTVCSQARNAHHALGSSHTDCSVIFCAPEKNLSYGVAHVSPLLFSHLPFTTSTSSSSFTLPSATTQEHAAQSVPQDQLQEHPVHHAHLQALPADKLRHQDSLWRENLQSGGNPRTITSTRSAQRSEASLLTWTSTVTCWRSGRLPRQRRAGGQFIVLDGAVLESSGMPRGPRRCSGRGQFVKRALVVLFLLLLAFHS